MINEVLDFQKSMKKWSWKLRSDKKKKNNGMKSSETISSNVLVNTFLYIKQQER